MEKKRKQGLAKKIAVMMLLSILFVFTGCVRYEVKLKIDEDGKTEVQMIYATLQTDSNSASSSSIAETKAKYLDAGYEVEDYIETEDGNTYIGIYVRKSGATLDQAIENMSSGDLEFGTLSLTKDEDGVYFLAMNYDSETEQAQSSGASSSVLEKYGGYMRFVIEIPGKVIESNATNVSGKTLTWDILSADEFMYAKFTLEGGGGFKIPMWVFGVLFGAIVIIGGVFFAFVIMSNKKKAESYVYTSPTPSSNANIDTDPVDAFVRNQNSGLPQMGNSYNSDSIVKDDADDTPVAPSPDGPIWARPASSDELPDSVEDLDDDSFLN